MHRPGKHIPPVVKSLPECGRKSAFRDPAMAWDSLTGPRHADFRPHSGKLREQLLARLPGHAPHPNSVSRPSLADLPDLQFPLGLGALRVTSERRTLHL